MKRRSCACGCGQAVPAGETRRWATPTCFVSGSEPGMKGRGQGRGAYTQLLVDKSGQEFWVR